MLAIAAVAGLLLAVGWWTPVADAVVAIIEASTAFMGTEHLRSVALLATAGTLALIGRGVWSIEARLLGRKRIDIPER
jgi:EamA domain-containing membrane protein RarD